MDKKDEVIFTEGKFETKVYNDKYSGHCISVQTNGFQSTVVAVTEIEQLVKLNECISEYIEKQLEIAENECN
jgi:hypothetical protein